ncbi:MAG: exonuclease SbcCD subunit D [Anaerolineales bacterium]|nr:exonuclease SbcCD subunit D [Anaerolineales bacterium]
MKLLHFADAHIDMANYGRHDPETGLPLRVLDFLKSLDKIISTAVEERVDLVIFAGDAYKDRSPAPTFQREWGRRIMRLSQAGIPTLLLVGNHDLSPAVGRAHALQEFDTLQIPHIHVLDTPKMLGPDELGIPLQVIAIPWVSRSGLMAALGVSGEDLTEVYSQMEDRISDLVKNWLEEADPQLPVILTAHASIQGASYGSERTVMLGADLVLSGSLVRDARLDYVAMGHIHKPQNLNENAHPPVIYPGSIERVDFGEAGDEKYFVIANVTRGKTQVEWRRLDNVRPFIDRSVTLTSDQDVTQTLTSALPENLEGAIVRLTITYPREWESLIDETALRDDASEAFEFHLVKRPRVETRIRLPEDQNISSISPMELLEKYWLSMHINDQEELKALQELAKEVLSAEEEETR